MMDEQGLQALVSPPNALVAPDSGSAGDLLYAITYAAAYNLLDFPAGVVPVTRVTQEDDDKMQKVRDKNMPRTPCCDGSKGQNAPNHGRNL